MPRAKKTQRRLSEIPEIISATRSKCRIALFHSVNQSPIFASSFRPIREPNSASAVNARTRVTVLCTFYFNPSCMTTWSNFRHNQRTHKFVIDFTRRANLRLCHLNNTAPVLLTFSTRRLQRPLTQFIKHSRITFPFPMSYKMAILVSDSGLKSNASLPK